MTDQVPHGPADRKCPLWRKKMSLVCHTCPLWVHIRGKDPQSNVELDRCDCSLAWNVVVGVETGQRVNQLAAAVESMRNEVAAALGGLSSAIQIASARSAAGQTLPGRPTNEAGQLPKNG